MATMREDEVSNMCLRTSVLKVPEDVMLIVATAKLLASLSSLQAVPRDVCWRHQAFPGHIDPKVCTKKQLSPHSSCCLLHCRCARGDP